MITFTEPVSGLEASDLLVDETPAASVSSADQVTFTFGFAQPSFGPVTIRWATNHGIRDVEVPANPFDPTRFGGQWDYTLIDPIPTVVLTSPADNSAFQAPAGIVVRATATDNDGTILRVEFYQGNAKLGESTTVPTFGWSNARGEYVPRPPSTIPALPPVGARECPVITGFQPFVARAVSPVRLLHQRGRALAHGCRLGCGGALRTHPLSDVEHRGWHE